MTKLEACNRLLRAIHEEDVPALDTGGVSVMGRAEKYLDDTDKEIQSEGWHCNSEYKVSMTGVDTTKQAMVIAAGTWTVATLTLTKTAAFTSYTWVKNDQIYVSGGTTVTPGWFTIASKTDSNSIVLKTSIAVANQVDITTTLIGWDDGIAVPSDVLIINSTDGKDVVVRGGMLYDRENDTFKFTTAITVELVRQLSFVTLPLLLQEYIVAKAAISFQRRMTEGKEQDTFLLQEYQLARYNAMCEETDRHGNRSALGWYRRLTNSRRETANSGFLLPNNPNGGRQGG